VAVCAFVLVLQCKAMMACNGQSAAGKASLRGAKKELILFLMVFFAFFAYAGFCKAQGRNPRSGERDAESRIK
jgi:hypothetical protein